MELMLLFQGFPGRSNRGFLGWSSCVLIRRPDRRPMLFDTLGFNERYTLLSRLQALGIHREEIGSVFISHFHFDHAVNYPLFPNAIFYMHAAEVQHIEQNGTRDLAVPVEMYPALRDSGRLVLLTGDEGEVEGLQWLRTPGHTPGLCSLLLEYQGKQWILASDAVKNIEELQQEKAAMAWNGAQSKASIQTIKRRADVVVPGHDRILEIDRTQDAVHIKPLTEIVIEIAVPGQQQVFTLKV